MTVARVRHHGMPVKQDATGEEASIDTGADTPYLGDSDLPMSPGIRPALLGSATATIASSPSSETLSVRNEQLGVEVER